MYKIRWKQSCRALSDKHLKTLYFSFLAHHFIFSYKLYLKPLISWAAKKKSWQARNKVVAETYSITLLPGCLLFTTAIYCKVHLSKLTETSIGIPHSFLGLWAKEKSLQIESNLHLTQGNCYDSIIISFLPNNITIKHGKTTFISIEK